MITSKHVALNCFASYCSVRCLDELLYIIECSRLYLTKHILSVHISCSPRSTSSNAFVNTESAFSMLITLMYKRVPNELTILLFTSSASNVIKVCNAYAEIYYVHVFVSLDVAVGYHLYIVLQKLVVSKNINTGHRHSLFA